MPVEDPRPELDQGCRLVACLVTLAMAIVVAVGFILLARHLWQEWWRLLHG